jgi:pimeloyl-ACP methyl ester carboxylesterase
MILLHGNFGSWMHWARNIEVLAETHRIFVPDLPGFGESGLPVVSTADEIAEMLELSLRSLAVWEDIDIVGFSFGASVAGALAKRLGERVKHLVIVSAGHLRLSKAPIAPFIPWRHLQTEEDRSEAHRRNLHAMMISRMDRIDDLAVYIQRENTSHRRLKTDDITKSHPLRPILDELDRPVVGIWGERDSTIGPFMHERLDLFRELGPRFTAHTISDAGHWLQYEAADRFNELLLSVLACSSPEYSLSSDSARVGAPH